MRLKGISRIPFVLFILLSCLLAASGCQPSHEPAGPATKVILVRHAEKAGGEGDVPLTEQGRERAKLLAELLAEAGVNTIYATEWRRNQETAKPLSERTGVPVTTFPVGTDATEHARTVAAKLKSGDHAGEVVVCIEHSNTIAPILAELGVEGFEGMAAYQQMFVVVLGKWMKTELLILRYDP